MAINEPPPENLSFTFHLGGTNNPYSSNIPTSGQLNIYTPLTGTGTEIKQGCPLGHQVNPEYLEYFDGAVTTQCLVCGDKITLARVPGGISLLKIKGLLGVAMAATEEADLSEVLGEFAQLRDDLEVEEFAVEETRRLLGLLEAVIKQKLTQTEAVE